MCGCLRFFLGLLVSVDEEFQRLYELREIKRRRLHELDKQAAAYGKLDVPAHISMERAELRKEARSAASASARSGTMCNSKR
jgi:hypothetical protein